MALYDYPRIRFNTALNALEMNVGGEDWELLPTGSGYVSITGGTMTGVLTPPHSTNATVTGTVTPVTGVSNYFYTVTGVATINGPATPTADGQKVMFRLLQDSSGHAVTFATGAGNFRFGTDITSFTASGANKTDYVGAIWNAAANRWDIVSVIQGF